MPLTFTMCDRPFRPGQVGSKEAIRHLLLVAKLEVRFLEYLEKLGILRTEEPAKTHVRFELDPLGEYLAAMKVVELCNEPADRWRTFFKDAEEKYGTPETARGFLLAIRDCCEASVEEYRLPEFVQNELTLLLHKV
jgi:hypothetical protein